MQTFAYTAREDSTGKKIKAEVEAESRQGAARMLTSRGLTPVEITAKSNKKSPLDTVLKRVKTKEKVIFSRQLATLINAGLPIVQSLTTVKDQTKNKNLKSVISSIVADVEAGSSFSDAIAKHPKIFDNVYISLVAAGESSGTLDTSLERIANQQEKDADIVSKVRGAMIYPLIVLAVMGAVLIFMVTTVLPQVKNLYSGLPGAELPLITRALLVVAHVLTHYWWLMVIVMVASIVVTTRWIKTGPGRAVIDSLKMHMWPAGPLFMKLYMARFTRTGATLVASGVPLLQMLSIASEAVNNVHIGDSIKKASEKVKGGKALSESLQGDPNFPDLVPNMIHIGEQSGSLENMLSKSADYYEKEVDNQVKSISTLVEPVLMVVIGIMAFIVVAAVLLPIYGLVGQVGPNGFKTK